MGAARPGPRGPIDGCESGAPGGGTADAGGTGALFRIVEHRAPSPREAEPRGGPAEAVLGVGSCGLISTAELGEPTACQAKDTNWASLDIPLRTSKPMCSGRCPGEGGAPGC